MKNKGYSRGSGLPKNVQRFSAEVVTFPEVIRSMLCGVSSVQPKYEQQMPSFVTHADMNSLCDRNLQKLQITKSSLP